MEKCVRKSGAALLALALVSATAGISSAQVTVAAARAANAFEAAQADAAATANDDTRVSVQLGGTFAAGNTQAAGVNAAFRFVVRRRIHQFTLEAAGNAGFANAITPAMGPYLVGVTLPAGQTSFTATQAPRSLSTTALNALVRARYDVFVSPNDALYISPLFFTDPIGGFNYRLSGQVGYARSFVNIPTVRRFWGEVGFDATYESLTTGVNRFAPMGRLFLGFEEKSQRYFQLTVGLEGLVNFAGLSNVVVGNAGGVDVTSQGPDIRLNSTVRVDSRVADWLSIGFSLTTRFLNTPTPLQLPGMDASGASYSRIERDKLDVTGLLTLVFQFTPSTPAAAPAR